VIKVAGGLGTKGTEDDLDETGVEELIMGSRPVSVRELREFPDRAPAENEFDAFSFFSVKNIAGGRMIQHFANEYDFLN